MFLMFVNYNIIMKEKEKIEITLNSELDRDENKTH